MVNKKMREFICLNFLPKILSSLSGDKKKKEEKKEVAFCDNH